MRRAFAMGITLVASVSWAQTPDDRLEAMQVCAQINDGPQRLACFDGVMRRQSHAVRHVMQPSSGGLPTDLTPVGPRMSGDWMVLHDRLGTGMVTAVLPASSGEGARGEPVELVAKCERGALVVYASWNTRLGTEAEVTAMIGQDEPIVRAWPLSEDQEVTLLPADPEGFLLRLATTSSLVLSVMPPDGQNKITALFELKGYDEVLPELQRACRF